MSACDYYSVRHLVQTCFKALRHARGEHAYQIIQSHAAHPCVQIVPAMQVFKATLNILGSIKVYEARVDTSMCDTALSVLTQFQNRHSRNDPALVGDALTYKVLWVCINELVIFAYDMTDEHVRAVRQFMRVVLTWIPQTQRDFKTVLQTCAHAIWVHDTVAELPHTYSNMLLTYADMPDARAAASVSKENVVLSIYKLWSETDYSRFAQNKPARPHYAEYTYSRVTAPSQPAPQSVPNYSCLQGNMADTGWDAVKDCSELKALYRKKSLRCHSDKQCAKLAGEERGECKERADIAMGRVNELFEKLKAELCTQ